MHNTDAISVIDGGSSGGIFTSTASEENQGTIRTWAMNARAKDDTFLFWSVDRGHPGQIYLF